MVSRETKQKKEKKEQQLRENNSMRRSDNIDRAE